MNELLHFAARIFAFDPEKRQQDKPSNTESSSSRESRQEIPYPQEHEHNPYIHAPRLFELL